jgi:hypothetical protein
LELLANFRRHHTKANNPDANNRDVDGSGIAVGVSEWSGTPNEVPMAKVDTLAGPTKSKIRRVSMSVTGIGKFWLVAWLFPVIVNVNGKMPDVAVPVQLVGCPGA